MNVFRYINCSGIEGVHGMVLFLISMWEIFYVLLCVRYFKLVHINKNLDY